MGSTGDKSGIDRRQEWERPSGASGWYLQERLGEIGFAHYDHCSHTERCASPPKGLYGNASRMRDEPGLPHRGVVRTRPQYEELIPYI